MKIRPSIIVVKTVVNCIPKKSITYGEYMGKFEYDLLDKLRQLVGVFQEGF